MALGSKAFSVIFDARQFTEGMVLSRKELSFLKSTIQEIQTPLDEFNNGMQALEKLFWDGALSIDEYTAATTKLLAALPENVAAQKMLNEQLAKAETLRQQAMTAEEKHAAEIKQTNEAIDASTRLRRAELITEEQHANNLRELNGLLAKQQAAYQSLTATQREHAAVESAQATFAREKMKSSLRDAIASQDVANKQSMFAAAKQRRELMDAFRAQTAGVNPFGKDTGPTMFNALASDVRLLSASQANAIPIVGQFSSSIAAVGPAALVAVAGIGAAVAGFKSLEFVLEGIFRQAAKIDEVGKAANKLGVAVGDLQVFRELADDIGGIDAETADKGLKEFSITLAKAAQGSKEDLAIFQRLGLSVNDLVQMDSVHAAAAFGEALKGVGNHAEKMKLLQDAFGKSGVALRTALEAGTSAMKEQDDFLGSIGVKLSELETSQVASMRNAWDDVAKITEGIWTRLAVEAAPLLESVAEIIKETVVDSGLLKMGFDAIPPVIEAAAAAVAGLQVALGAAAQTSSFFVQAMGFARADRDLINLGQKMSKIGSANFAEGLAGGIGKRFQDNIEEARNAAARAKTVRGDIEGEESIDAERTATEKLTASFWEYIDALDAKRIAMQLGERAAEEQRLKDKQFTDDQRAAAMAMWDEVHALEEQARIKKELASNIARQEQKAIDEELAKRKHVASAIDELAKQVRQQDMTAEQKRIDDLIAAGANEEELEQVRILQQQLKVRKEIVEQQKASVDATRVGTRQFWQMYSDALNVVPHRNRWDDLLGANKPRGGDGGGLAVPVQVAPQQAVVPEERRAADQLDVLKQIEKNTREGLTLEVEEVTL